MYIISYDLNTEKIENIANENLRTTWAKHKENADEFLFVRHESILEACRILNTIFLLINETNKETALMIAKGWVKP